MFFELLLMDIRGLFSDLRPHDFGPPFFWTMWALIVISSLRGVDRRDEIAQVTYMAFVSAFGVVFILVFPIGRPQAYTPLTQIVLFSVLLIVPSLRWMMRRRLTDLDRRLAEAKAKKE